jgi:hypothetical protein
MAAISDAEPARKRPQRGGSIGATRSPKRQHLGRYLLLWLLGVAKPILLLIWTFGGLH